MSNDTYNTLADSAEGMFKDKGSKFIAYAYPVRNEIQVKEYIQQLKKKHYDARHHCYAYRMGEQGVQYRANDDGEPSGTAGKPILGQLLSYNLTNVLVVVVRYFGGILLGTSGLINAYKNATIDVISNATIVEQIWSTYLTLTFAYPALNEVMKTIKEEQLEVIEQQFDLTCTMVVRVRNTKVDQTCSRIGDIDTVKYNIT